MPTSVSRPDGAIYSLSAPLVTGESASLASFRGQVLLVVNTASHCGFTPQYQDLEQLHRRFHDRGFSVLGFPCNQFGQQEPGSNPEIGAFCQRNYAVTFPLFARIDVNGPGAHPLYQYLKDARRGFLGMRRIQWNFTKFLIDRHGGVVARYAPATKPQVLVPDIERLLAQPAEDL